MPKEDPTSTHQYRLLLESQERYYRSILLPPDQQRLRAGLTASRSAADMIATAERWIAADKQARATVIAELTNSRSVPPQAIAEPAKEISPPVAEQRIARGRRKGSVYRIKDERARAWLQSTMQKRHYTKSLIENSWKISAESITRALDPEIGVSREKWDEMMAKAGTSWAKVVGEP